MGARSAIEWTDASWTPIRARVKDNAAEIARAKGYASLVQIAERMHGHIGPHCERVSAGCGDSTGGGCYSEANNARCLPSNGTGLPFDRRARDLVDIFIDEKMLMQQLKWKQPKRIFVCSQTDLFGEFITDAMIDRLFAVMAFCHWHTFQVLTKRAKRLHNYMHGSGNCFGNRHTPIIAAMNEMVGEREQIAAIRWPLPNVFLGVSVEDQQRADERIPWLLKTPAAVRFLSCEPLLGPVDLSQIPTGEGRGDREYDPIITMDVLWRASVFAPHVHWVIVGGESGPGARPMHPDWVRSVRDQCVAAGVSFFLKQWGEWSPVKQSPKDHWCVIDRAGNWTPLATAWNGKTGADSETGEEYMYRVGKKAAGRLLDGVLWDEFPKAVRHA